MTRDRLHQDIARLRGEIETLAPDDAARHRITALLDEIEGEVGTRVPDDAARPRVTASPDEVEGEVAAPAPWTAESSLADPIRAAIDQFEVSHPRATAILNDIMVTLGNLGI
jgi:hypothetical protein